MSPRDAVSRLCPPYFRGVVLLLGIALLNGCNPSPPSQRPKNVPPVVTATLARPAARPTNYVGSAVCRECHQEIAAKYAAHPMGRSASTIETAPQIESFPHPHVIAPGGFEYLAKPQDGRQVHHEMLRDADNSILYDQAVPMDYIIGSGHRGRSYLAMHGDYLVISALTWYSQRKTWDLSPGYAKTDRHFERRAVDGCLQCHVGRVASGSGPDRIVKPVFHEAAIGCERCHGPAEKHVEWRRAHPNADDSRDDPIVNPANLPPLEREAVCQQCHLLGGERVLRYGRSEYDFRPGDDLSAVWVIFTRGSTNVTNDSTAAVNQVPQMMSSRCYLASEGRLGCTSCHDPHSVPDSDQVVEYYRGRCLQCHTASTPCRLSESERLAQQRDDSCVACHMPKLPANDVPHTSQTDHRIVRKAQITANSAVQAADEQMQLWGGMRDRLPAAEIDRARGLLMARFARDMKDVVLATAAEEVLQKVSANVDDVDVWRALGDLYSLQQRPEMAEDFWRRSLKAVPEDEETLRRLGIHYHEAGRDAEAAEMFTQCLALNPWDRAAAGRMVHVLGRLQRLDEALALAEQTAARYPWDTPIQEWLANAYQAQGRVAEAERCRAIAVRLRRDR